MALAASSGAAHTVVLRHSLLLAIIAGLPHPFANAMHPAVCLPESVFAKATTGHVGFAEFRNTGGNSAHQLVRLSEVAVSCSEAGSVPYFLIVNGEVLNRSGLFGASSTHFSVFLRRCVREYCTAIEILKSAPT